MKALRYLLLAVAGLFLLLVIAVGVVLFILDPNDFKPQIETAVEERTNLDLVLDGDIGWSFIPLGLELNDVEATLEGERLVRLEQLIAEVDVWSLIAMSPQVSTFSLDGLDARLRVDENGQGNWTRIMKETPEDGDGSAADAEAAPQAADNGTAQEDSASEGESTPINFNVEDVNISNARVHYDDAATGRSVTLENFSLQASQITLGREFPLSVAFNVALSEPRLTIDGEIEAGLSANEALDEFTVSDLDSRFEMSGDLFKDETVEAGITGGVTANLTDETASIRGLRASLANFALETDLSVVGFGQSPQLEGELDIPEFSLRELLSSLGQPEMETADPEVLEALSFYTDIGGPPGQLELSNLNIAIDDTTFTGDMRYRLDNAATALNLQGDAFNADRYLPPSGDEEAEADAPAQGESSGGGAAEEGDLLPLETLRTLALDIDLGLEELIVSNLTITEIATAIDANEGLLELTRLSGKLYDGDFDTNVTIDARQDNPTWDIGGEVNNVATRFLLTDLADLDMLAGAANLDLDIASSGNRMSVLRENADGEISFSLEEGEFTRMNLTRMACQGIALANSEQLTTSEWGNGTPFNDMRGTLEINGNTLNNTDLVAALAGMELRGEGSIDMKASELDYEAGLRIVGEIHRDRACRVSEYVQDVVIPLECRGNFTEDPGGLCSFDGSRFRDTLKDIAANAARAKVQEETERARERAEERAREEIDKRLGEDGEAIKDSIRGLFNR